MSSSIAIPNARQPVLAELPLPTIASPSQHSSEMHISTSPSGSLATSSPASCSIDDRWTSPVAKRSVEEKGKGKGKGKRSSFGSVIDGELRPRRVSWLGNEISRSEHTVVDVGNIGGVPRLITCVKASQGFDWNQDIFLPSYAMPESLGRYCNSGDLERRPDPVQEIRVSDEEMQDMLPHF